MKRNLLFRLFLSVVALFSVSLLTSCESKEGADDGVPSLAVSTATLLFDADGAPADDNAGVLEIESNRDWTVVVPESAAEWLTVSPATGKGNGKVSFSMPASNVARQATLSVEIRNSYGVLDDEKVVIKQEGSGAAGGNVDKRIAFDGSELPSAYEEDSIITKEGMEFTISFVANYQSQYPDSHPIQFGKSGSYLYNNMELAGLKTIVIELLPAGTTYNNFEIFAGTAQNPEGEAIAPSKSGDICTYTLPEGSTYFSIQNNANYTSYANVIEVLCGDAESELGGGTVDPGTDPEVDPEVAPETIVEVASVMFDGSEFIAEYAENATISKGEVDFIANLVANYTEKYPDSAGRIQFKAGGSSIYNTVGLKDLSSVVILLRPEGTKYNNFEVYAGTTVNPKGTAIEGVREGDICTYTIPAGSTCFSIENNSTHASYAHNIEILCGDTESSLGGGAVDPGTDPEVDPDADLVEVAAVTFDGSELPTTYPADEVIKVDDVDFTLNNVANFSNANGPIQFKKGGSYLYNNVGLKDLRAVVIELGPAGTEHNNFEVYAGTAMNPEGDKIEGVREGDICTYTLPTGSTFFAIENNSGYAAYSTGIEALCGDTESSLGGTVDPGTDPEVGDEVSIVLKGGNGMPEESATGKFETEGASFAYYYACYNSYGSYSIPSGDGYICNETEFNGLSKIVITEDYQYYNFTLYVGNEANPRTKKVEYTKEGDDYIYTIPAGNKFFAIVNESTHAANGDEIEIVYESLGETSTITPPVEEEIEGTHVDITPEMLMGGAEIVDGENKLSDITVGIFDFAFVHGSTNSRVWKNNSGVDMRFYNGSKTTISSESATIKRIIFDATPSKINFTVDSGEIVDSEWTGSTKSLTLSATATSTLGGITIVYEE